MSHQQAETRLGHDKAVRHL